MNAMAFLLLLCTSFQGYMSNSFSILASNAKIGYHVASIRRIKSMKMHFDEEISLQIAEKVHPSIVRVVPIGVRNMTAEGSGFVVPNLDSSSNDENRSLYILTAAHVVSGSKNTNVHFSGKDAPEIKTCSANVIARNDRMDLALLHISESHITVSNNNDEYSFFIPSPLAFVSTAPKTGQLAFANGYLPNRNQIEGIVMTSGIVCGISKGIGSNRKDSNTTYILTNAGMSAGMSGGPIVDKNGLVLGVNSMIRMDLGTLGHCAVAAKDCIDFIQHAFSTTSKKTIGYKVLLYNDPMNKRQRVANVLTDIAKLNLDDANACMMLAHNEGVGVVREFLFSDSDDCDCLADAKKLSDDLRNQDLLSAVEKIIEADYEAAVNDSQILVPF